MVGCRMHFKFLLSALRFYVVAMRQDSCDAFSSALGRDLGFLFEACLDPLIGRFSVLISYFVSQNCSVGKSISLSLPVLAVLFVFGKLILILSRL